MSSAGILWLHSSRTVQREVKLDHMTLMVHFYNFEKSFEIETKNFDRTGTLLLINQEVRMRSNKISDQRLSETQAFLYDGLISVISQLENSFHNRLLHSR